MRVSNVHIYNTQRQHWPCLIKTPEQMHAQKRKRNKNL